MITIRMEVSDIKYIIMLLIVIGLAIADLVTGWIKACVCEELRSSKMRRGGLGKLAEVVVMAAAVGSEIGFSVLGRYYGHELLGNWGYKQNGIAGANFIARLGRQLSGTK